jgi:hypothetical protein
LLRRVYGAVSSPQVSRDELDDLLIMDAWLRRHRDVVHEVIVPIDDPQQAAPALRAAMLPAVAA